jgi:outer membrane protein
MKSSVRSSFPALRMLALCALLGAASVSLRAETKVAVINLKTVFDGYWKTKQADVQLKDRATDFDKARRGLVDDYQKANEDYRKLVDTANDQAASSDEREKRKKSAEAKLMELREIEQNITQFDRNAREQLGSQQKRMRDTILREIRDLVNTKAKSGNYGLVLDTAAESANQTPIVLFQSGQPDLTDEVLNQLNATAPAGALTGDKVDDKDKEKEKEGDKDSSKDTKKK